VTGKVSLGFSLFGVACVLAACGGGGIAPDVPSYDAKVMDLFSDGSGIIKSTHNAPVTAVARSIQSQEASDRLMRIIWVPDADDAVERDPAGFDVSLDQLENFLTTDLGKYYRTKEGETVTINGQQATVALFQDSTSGTTIISSTVDSLKTVQVVGPEVTNLPNDTATYTGTNLLASMTYDWPSERGEFEMVVDFTQQSATITASTTSSSLSGTLEIDADTGALTGSNLALVSPDGTDTATFIGTFNGVGASGVSAFYYDNNDLPTVNGAIVGSR